MQTVSTPTNVRTASLFAARSSSLAAAMQPRLSRFLDLLMRCLAGCAF